jgi:hypothetical protein
MQVDKAVYFALLIKKCADPRQPRSDESIVRLFNNALKAFKVQQKIREGYEQNHRSIEYVVSMAKELEIVFKNNKQTPWGRVLDFLIPDEVPLELPAGAKVFFLKCFLLEDFAFVKSLYDHISRFSKVCDDYLWYKETTGRRPERDLTNHAFSIYLNAIRIAVDSVDGVIIKRRYLKLYREALRTGKTAKALYPKIKPALGIMEDLNLLERRKSVDGRIGVLQINGHRPYSEIMTRFPSYRAIASEELKNNSLVSTLIEVCGYPRIKTLSENEMISCVEDLYKKLSDPVFGVCDMNTLISVIVIEKGLQGYDLSESDVKETIMAASKKDAYKYQILSDRLGHYRFLKIKL